MIRARNATIAILAFLAAAAAAAGAPASDRSARPDVILITAHSLRPDHLGCHGYERMRTPALDKLASSGLVFENAYCNVPVPVHSYGSILTGVMGSLAVQPRGGFIALADPARTLGEYLTANGYTTAAIASDASLLPAMDPATKGFAAYADVAKDTPDIERAARDTAATDKALAALKDLKDAKQPIFAWISYSIPRYPYEVPKDFKLLQDDFPYDRQVLFLDAEIGRLLEGLARLGMDRNTAIIFTAATGESLGEHREPDHGIFLYNATVKVPLIIRFPDKRAGKRISAPVSHADIVPTILDYLHIRYRDDDVDGMSLISPAWRKRAPGRTIPLESLVGHALFGWSPLVGIVTERYKYIEAPAPELYDLSRDGHELKNIAATGAAAAAGLKEKVFAYARDRRPALVGAAGKGADPKDVIDVYTPYLMIKRSYTDENANFLTGMYERLLEKDPRNKAFRYELARLYLRDDRFHSAEKILLSLNDDYPDSGRAWELLGEVYNQLNRKDDAIVCYEKAVSITPDSPVLLNNLAWHYAQGNEDLPRALRYAERANELAGDNASFLDTLAEVRYRMGDTAKAVELLRKALEIDPGSSYLQGRIEAMEGKK